MKYANGCLLIRGRQFQGFICAKTYKRMLELYEEIIGHSLGTSYFNNYWSKCGNDKMKETAKDKEGIWIREEDYSGDYKKR